MKAIKKIKLIVIDKMKIVKPVKKWGVTTLFIVSEKETDEMIDKILNGEL